MAWARVASQKVWIRTPTADASTAARHPNTLSGQLLVKALEAQGEKAKLRKAALEAILQKPPNLITAASLDDRVLLTSRYHFIV